MNTKRFLSKLVFFFTFFVIRVAMHFICCRLPALRHEIVFEASISYVFFPQIKWIFSLTLIDISLWCSPQIFGFFNVQYFQCIFFFAFCFDIYHRVNACSAKSFAYCMVLNICSPCSHDRREVTVEMPDLVMGSIALIKCCFVKRKNK